MITSPGLHPDIDEEVYHADPCPEPSLSASLAKTIIGESALHGFLQHPRLGLGSDDDESEDEAEAVKAQNQMDKGTLAHSLLLGRGRPVVICEEKTWQKNIAKEFRINARAAGNLPVLRKWYTKASAMRAGAEKELKRLGFWDLHEAGKSEITGACQRDGLWMRARFDRLTVNEEAGVIFDWKIGKQSNPAVIDRHIADMDYDLGAEMYRDILERIFPALAGRTRYVLLFQEPTSPFCLVPTELNGEFRALGQMKYTRAFETWKRCLDTGIWPGYAEGIHHAAPPAYAVTREYEKLA